MSMQNKTADVNLDIEVGDIILTGRYKNKRQVVEALGTDDLGQPTVNNMKLLAIRLEKKLPDSKKSAETLRLQKAGFMAGYLHKAAEKTKKRKKCPPGSYAVWEDGKRRCKSYSRGYGGFGILSRRRKHKKPKDHKPTPEPAPMPEPGPAPGPATNGQSNGQASAGQASAG